MKILREEVEKFVKILINFPYRSNIDDYALFIPIDGDDVGTDSSDLLILTEKEERGVNSFVKPGLLLRNRPKGCSKVEFAFVHTAYQYNMKMQEFVDLYVKENTILNEEDLNALCSKEVLLVKKENIMASFNI